MAQFTTPGFRHPQFLTRSKVTFSPAQQKMVVQVRTLNSIGCLSYHKVPEFPIQLFLTQQRRMSQSFFRIHT